MEQLTFEYYPCSLITYLWLGSIYSLSTHRNHYCPIYENCLIDYVCGSFLISTLNKEIYSTSIEDKRKHTLLPLIYDQQSSKS